MFCYVKVCYGMLCNVLFFCMYGMYVWYVWYVSNYGMYVCMHACMYLCMYGMHVWYVCNVLYCIVM